MTEIEIAGIDVASLTIDSKAVDQRMTVKVVVPPFSISRQHSFAAAYDSSATLTSPRAPFSAGC